MKMILGMASILMLSNLVYAQSQIPTKIDAEIKDAFCGNLYELSSQKSNKLNACLLWVQTKSGAKYGIFTGNNAYLTTILDSSTSAKKLIGHNIQMSSCEDLSGFGGRYFREVYPHMTVDKSYAYGTCYEGYHKLIPSEKDLLSPSQISGTYMGRSKLSGKLINASVQAENIQSQAEDLFSKPIMYVDVSYYGTNKVDVDSFEALSFSFSSDDLAYMVSETGNYFTHSTRQDCDDPDCYNTDGEVRFIKNKSGSTTLYINIEHYNNAPNEYGDEDDVTDEVFLKKNE